MVEKLLCERDGVKMRGGKKAAPPRIESVDHAESELKRPRRREGRRSGAGARGLDIRGRRHCAKRRGRVDVNARVIPSRPIENVEAIETDHECQRARQLERLVQAGVDALRAVDTIRVAADEALQRVAVNS